MDNDRFEQEDEPLAEERKTGCGCLTAVVIVIVLIMSVPLLIHLIDSWPITVDSKSNNGLKVELQAIGSPVGPIGPQDGRVWLKLGSFKICSEDFVLHNDGKGMDEYNWKVDWKEDSVLITIIGEEQADEHITLYYDGKTESDTNRITR